MHVLDCTLRDGGYYTNWDFDHELVASYIESFDSLPVAYLEIGYRSKQRSEYLGEYFYCPVHVLNGIKERTSKKLAVMLNEKDVSPEDVEDLLVPCKGLVDMVRIAVDPEKFSRALRLTELIRRMGFEIGFNVMYMSSWASKSGFISQLSEVNGLVDYFYMVDSYGGVYPQDVKDTYELVRSKTNVAVGFHGHNNLELALINTLTAIDCGATIVDSTVTGMGRGAGNLKTELLLTALQSRGLVEFDFNSLSGVVDPFVRLQQQYGWGSNLPYMVSGAHSLPQKDVMDWVTTRYYSLNSIIRALSNQSKGVKDNLKLPKLDFKSEIACKTVFIIGGGPSAMTHMRALHEYLRQHKEMPIIHASSKNALSFSNCENLKYFCLVGNEGHRLERVFTSVDKIEGKCILPPFPRKMGTYIPSAKLKDAFELELVGFTDQFMDSHTALALQTAIELGAERIIMAGYDGYTGASISQREQDLYYENEFLFEKIKDQRVECISITPTTYKQLIKTSVYSLIS